MQRTIAYLVFLALASTGVSAQKSVQTGKPAAICNLKAGSVVIYSNGVGDAVGQFEGRMDANGNIDSQLASPVVHVWRDFTPDDDEIVKKYRLTAGKAYQELPDARLKLLCNVSLALTNEQIAAIFSVKAK
jgi:hypothetical protein